MTFRSLAGALTGAFVLVAQAGAVRAEDTDAIVLEPIEPWLLDMAEHKCRLSRVFGSAGKPNVFYLEQWNPSDSAEWIVAGPAVEYFRSSRDVAYSFGPGGDADSFEFTETTLGEFGNVVGGSSTIAASAASEDLEEDEIDYRAHPRGLPRLDSDAAAGIDTFTVWQKGRSPVTLKLGSMDKPLAAMNTCMADLVEHWGFDVEKQKTVAIPPRIENLRKVAGYVERYYPSDALRAGAQADFHLRLTIDETGAIANCSLVNQTLAEDFDMNRHPCTIFKKYAEVEPARAADGSAIPTYYATRIIYRMARW